jgi:hypothetical protein
VWQARSPREIDARRIHDAARLATKKRRGGDEPPTTRHQEKPMATPQEIAEVQAFLAKHDGEWLGMSCEPAEEECPALLHRKEDESDPIAYHINAVCVEAGIAGGIEEHGYGDWLATTGETE